MNQLFQNILTASFHGSIVILVVMLLRLVLKKTPKKFLCLLWLLAGIRLLMPFEIKSDMSLQPAPEPIVQQMVQEEIIQLPPEVLSEYLPQAAAPTEAVSPILPISPVPAATEAVSPVETVTVHESVRIDWTRLLPWLWLCVASLFLVYTLYSYISLRLLVREAVKIPGGWECDRIETAFILGFIRPKIYIPMGLSSMVRKHILAHERTHLEKGDHWFKMIGFIALALHWFNPLVWIAYILLCKDIEMACDERVVQFMELQERKEYSAALLNCSTNKAHFAACPVAFGEVSVKHRIKSVLKYKKPSFWISLAGVLAIIFVAVCLVTSPAEEASADPTATTGAENTVTVWNVDQLLDAIAPDTEIILKPGTYNLCDAKNYGGETGSDYYSWVGGYDGSELLIRGVENLIIRGSGRLSTNIETDPRWADVIQFQNASNITLEGFTAGHTEQGECSGGVLYMEGCNNVTMNDLGLYGCGVVGLTADLCSNVSLTGSEIYECSSSAVILRTSSNVTVSGCRIRDIGHKENGGYVFFEISSSRNVTVDNCEFSLSSLNHLMITSFSQTTFRNNLFAGNRFRGSVFSIQGDDVVLQDNRFDGNTVRSWYDGYGNPAKDAEGNALTEEVLNGLYPIAPKDVTQPQLEIHVSTVDEFIAAIGPNTRIVLDGDLYDLSTATGYGTSSSTYYYWEDVYDGPGLVIRDVDNMTVTTATGDVSKHTISAVPRYADVLAFQACSNVSLSGFTAGHTIEPGSCAGGVIEFRDCDNMRVEHCGLYGCGILGVYAEYSTNIQVLNCDIYECSQGGIFMRNTDTIVVEGNTFRDLGGDETTFSGCSNVNLDGQLLNPRASIENNMLTTDPEQEISVADEEDLVNLGHAVSSFARALFAGDEESMRLHLVSGYDRPIEIPEEVIGAELGANQELPEDYAGEMERQGYCTLSVMYFNGSDYAGVLVMEMCRENGVWKVQYYTLKDTEIALLDRVLWNFTYAYLLQDLERMELHLSEEYNGSVEVYFGDGYETVPDPDYSVGTTFSNAQLADLDAYSAAVPFHKTQDDPSWTYLNVALKRRENPKTYTEGGLTFTEPAWEVVDYGLSGAATPSLAEQYSGLHINAIEGENFTGTVMTVTDPARVFLGTSTDDFSPDTPGKRIGEIMDAYPGAVAAVNAGAFYDDGTSNTAVGATPIGLTVAAGETLWTDTTGQAPSIHGFAGFTSDHVLVVSDRDLTAEEAEKLGIRDGCSVGPALIIDGQMRSGAAEQSSLNPRTAIGQKADGTVILLCINGRVFNSAGATYADVANLLWDMGAINACMMQGGSATGMMHRPDGSGTPELLTQVHSMSGEPLSNRRLPTYWMVAGE